MPERIPRELPSSSSFSTPHVQCLVGARYFLKLLEELATIAASRAEELRVANQNEDLAYIDGALERQALSEAVQVFAAMTAEGAVNLLGVLILGEDFYTSLERKPLLEKLSHLLATIEKPNEAVHTELLALTTTLSQARNSFVHPKPKEGPPAPHQGRGASLSNAREALDEAIRFLVLLQQVSYRYRPFFHVWQ